QALLRTRGLFVGWRGEVDACFHTIDPALEAALYPADAPRRLVVQIYGSGIGVQRERLWKPFKGMGVRVPRSLEGAGTTEAFLRELIGAVDAGRGAPALLTRTIDSPLDGWIVESDTALHEVCGAGTPAALTGLSYSRLRP